MLGRRSWEELDDDEQINSLRKIIKALGVAVLALLVGGGCVAIILYSNAQYLEGRAKVRDDQNKDSVCLTLGYASPKDPLARKQHERFPDCPIGDRAQRYYGVPAPAKPSASAVAPGQGQPTQSPQAGPGRPSSSGSAGRTAVSRTSVPSAVAAPTPGTRTTTAIRTAPAPGTTKTRAPQPLITVCARVLVLQIGCATPPG